MSRFFAVVSKPARDMAAHFPGPAASPKPTPTAAQPQLIRLDSNENPFGPSPRAIEAMRSALATQNFYPDDDSTELRRRLALHHQVSQEQILVTAGSTEMLALLCQTMLAPGLNAVTSERSFIIYSMAVHATGAQLVQSPMRGEVFALEAIRAAINQNTRIVFLANPNNPTGTMLEATAIDEFLTNIPAHVVVVLDEAYYEFAVHFAALRQLEYSRSLEYLQRGANVIVLRTFSKAHGLAGLRVGYGLGPADHSDVLRAHAQPILGFFRRPGCGHCCARRPRPYRTSRFEQRVAGTNSHPRSVRDGSSCGPHFRELSLLRRKGRGFPNCGLPRRRRRQRATVTCLGLAELDPCKHRDARTKRVFSKRDAQDRWSIAAHPTLGARRPNRW